MPAAYSYLRFSSPRQADGDTVRRQTEVRGRWLKDHPDATLDTSLNLDDFGRSAYHRGDWDTYALARFVECVKTGRVAKGSYLLVENLDRLSRESAGEATELFLSIVNKGIVVVQLSPVVMEFRKPVDMMSLMFAIVELSRGHSESAMKSERVAKAWAAKRNRASKELVTKRVPGWLTVDPKTGKPVAVREKVAVVRRIFAMAREGFGGPAIAAKLNAEKVPVFGRATFRRGGKEYKVAWSEQAVYYVLKSRAVLGEFQPKKRLNGADRKPGGPDRAAVGEPVADYYPRVIDEDLFLAVQAAIDRRKAVGRGRKGRHVNLFAGLLRHGIDGGTVFYWHRARGQYPVLAPLGTRRAKGTVSGTFPADVFELALLSELREVRADDVWAESDGARKVEAISGRLAEVEALRAKWRAKMDSPDLVDEVAAKLAELNARHRELSGELAAAQAEAASPLAEAWGSARTLADALAADRGSDDVRTKVRAALRRCIDSVTVVFANPGQGSGDRIASATVAFVGSDEIRNCIIFFRPPRGNGKTKSTPARWAVRSVNHPKDRLAANLLGDDLRDVDRATAAAEGLAAYPSDVLDRVLRSGRVVGP